MKKLIVVLTSVLFTVTMSMGALAVTVPLITIDGAVVESMEVTESVIVTEIKKVQQMYIEDRAAGNNWVYRNNTGRSSARTFEEAFANGQRWTQCADGTNKILKGAGVIPLDTGHFFGNASGDISWGGNAKAVIESVADVYHYNNGTTVGQLMSSGVLQAGDVITYVGFNHTNIYAGDGYWWDSGHAHCTCGGENAPFWTFYGNEDKSGLQVGCLIRFRNQFPTAQAPEIVIENVYSPLDENGDDDGIFIWPDDDGWEEYMSGIEVDGVEVAEIESEAETEKEVSGRPAAVIKPGKEGAVPASFDVYSIPAAR